MKKKYEKLKISNGLNSVDLNGTDLNIINGFGILKLINNTYESHSKSNEICLMILNGKCTIRIDDKFIGEAGKRKNVFEGLPEGIYIPPNTKFLIESDNAEIAICQTKCESTNSDALIINESNVIIKEVGKDNWKREVRTVLGSENSFSKNMIVGETLNPPGNWSGTPPHKHDKDNLPMESLHEEIYYFKTDKPQGWGMERFYSKEKNFNELIYIEDNSITYMPYGYHQIVSAPGYTLYYLFFLAGNNTNLQPNSDKDHDWILDDL